MTIIPAIDLLGGVCVRLTRGDYERVTRYSTDPVEVARGFEAAGARWLHVVDLDAARGSPATDRSASGGCNRRVIRAVARTVSCKIEVGGGIRTLRDVEACLEAGAARLVVGTALIRNPGEVERWCGVHPEILWGGIDAEDGVVKVSGWRQKAALRDVELAARVPEMGLGGIVYTSIRRDGTLEGPDIERTNRVARVSGVPVILSGGIGGPEDVRRVAELGHPGITGLIIGKAIYQGRIDPAQLFNPL